MAELAENLSIPLNSRGPGLGFTSTPVSAEKTVTITGSGFGLEPNVVFYRDFQNGLPGSPVPTANGIGDIGAVSTSLLDFGFVHGETCALGFSHSGQSGRRMQIDFPSNVQKMNFMSNFCIPPGKLYPSAFVSNPGEYGGASDLKQYWFLHSDGADSAALADLAYASINGSFRLTGNSVNLEPDAGELPGWGSGDADEYWDDNGWTAYQVIQDCDLNAPVTGGVTHRAYCSNSLTGVSKTAFTRVVTWNQAAFNVDSSTLADADAFYSMLRVNSFATASNTKPKRTEIAYKDIYMAVPSGAGVEDYKQMVFLGDAATLANCTKRKAKVASAWSDTSVSVNVTGVEQNFYSHAYVMKADGNVEVVAI